MTKLGQIAVLCLLTWLVFSGPVYASYMLPYPSYLPGHRLYSVSRLYDRLMAYWYFGNIASTRYHLQLSDKYLVESRTLFEYGQYLLALDALDRSDREFSEALAVYAEGVTEGSDLSAVTEKLSQAADEHVRVIGDLVARLPEESVWSTEKENSQILNLHERLVVSKLIRGESIKK